MNEPKQRIFLLYFSGCSQEEIATQLDFSTTQVNYVLNHNGQEWVANFLKEEYKLKLIQLAADGKNSQTIADEMGPPWNRWLVLWTLRRLESITKTAYHRTNQSANLNLQLLTFRCPICQTNFQSNLVEITANPDRICSNCSDRRKGDRREIQRSDVNQDIAKL